MICDIGAKEIHRLPYPLGSESELEETRRLIEEEGGSAVAITADLRDPAAVRHVVQTAEDLGGLDIAVINHAIATYGQIVEIDDEMWRDTLDTNLHSYFYLAREIAPRMAARGHGRIVMTSSGLARGGAANVGHYTAAKWGVIGLMKSVAAEVAASGVTVNCVLPLITHTPMILHEELYRLFRPDLSEPSVEDFKEACINYVHPMRVPWGEPSVITDTVMFLVSDAASLITGSALHPSGGDAIRTSS